MSTLYDRRREKRPVWEYVATQLSWANGAGHATKTISLTQNGIIKQLVMTFSEATNDPDITVIIQDTDGNQLYTTGVLNDGQTVVKSVATDFAEGQCCGNGFIISVAPSADAGTSGLTVDIVVRGV